MCSKSAIYKILLYKLIILKEYFDTLIHGVRKLTTNSGHFLSKVYKMYIQEDDHCKQSKELTLMVRGGIFGFTFLTLGDNVL